MIQRIETDKSKIWGGLKNLHIKWNTEYQPHFNTTDKEPYHAQILKSIRMLDVAETLEDCEEVDSRIQKLSDLAQTSNGGKKQVGMLRQS